MDYQIMLTELLKGLLVSVEIFVLTLVFSLPLGLIIALGRMSGNCIIRNIFRVYISIMRGAEDEQMNREALRVISMMPKWEAGKVNNKPVPVRCYLPIAFHL